MASMFINIVRYGPPKLYVEVLFLRMLHCSDIISSSDDDHIPKAGGVWVSPLVLPSLQCPVRGSP